MKKIKTRMWKRLLAIFLSVALVVPVFSGLQVQEVQAGMVTELLSEKAVDLVERAVVTGIEAASDATSNELSTILEVTARIIKSPEENGIAKVEEMCEEILHELDEIEHSLDNIASQNQDLSISMTELGLENKEASMNSFSMTYETVVKDYENLVKALQTYQTTPTQANLDELKYCYNVIEQFYSGEGTGNGQTGLTYNFQEDILAYAQLVSQYKASGELESEEQWVKQSNPSTYMKSMVSYTEKTSASESVMYENLAVSLNYCVRPLLYYIQAVQLYTIFKVERINEDTSYSSAAKREEAINNAWKDYEKYKNYAINAINQMSVDTDAVIAPLMRPYDRQPTKVTMDYASQYEKDVKLSFGTHYTTTANKTSSIMACSVLKLRNGTMYAVRSDGGINSELTLGDMLMKACEIMGTNHMPSADYYNLLKAKDAWGSFSLVKSANELSNLTHYASYAGQTDLASYMVAEERMTSVFGNRKDDPFYGITSTYDLDLGISISGDADVDMYNLKNVSDSKLGEATKSVDLEDDILEKDIAGNRIGVVLKADADASIPMNLEVVSYGPGEVKVVDANQTSTVFQSGSSVTAGNMLSVKVCPEEGCMIKNAVLLGEDQKGEMVALERFISESDLDNVLDYLKTDDDGFYTLKSFPMPYRNVKLKIDFQNDSSPTTYLTTLNQPEKVEGNIVGELQLAGLPGIDQKQYESGDWVTIYARAEQPYFTNGITVTDSSGNEVEVQGVDDKSTRQTFNSGTKVYCFQMPESNVTVTEQLEVCRTVTAKSDGNGTIQFTDASGKSIEKDQDKRTYQEGDTVYFQEVPDDSALYFCEDIIVKGVTSGKQILTKRSESGYSFHMPDEDVVIYATFSSIGTDAYMVTANMSGQGVVRMDGNDSLNGKYKPGDKVTITMISAAGYQLEDYSVKKEDNDVTVEENLVLDEAASAKQISFIMPRGNVSVAIDFEQISPTIKGTVSAGGGLHVNVTQVSADGQNDSQLADNLTNGELQVLAENGDTFTLSVTSDYEWLRPENMKLSIGTETQDIHLDWTSGAGVGSFTVNESFGESFRIGIDTVAIALIEEDEGYFYSISDASKKYKRDFGTDTAGNELVYFQPDVNYYVSYGPDRSNEMERLYATIHHTEGVTLGSDSAHVIAQGNYIARRDFSVQEAGQMCVSIYQKEPAIAYYNARITAGDGTTLQFENSEDETQQFAFNETVTVVGSAEGGMLHLTILDQATQSEVISECDVQAQNGEWRYQFKMPGKDVIITSELRKESTVKNVTAQLFPGSVGEVLLQSEDGEEIQQARADENIFLCTNMEEGYELTGIYYMQNKTYEAYKSVKPEEVLQADGRYCLTLADTTLLTSNDIYVIAIAQKKTCTVRAESNEGGSCTVDVDSGVIGDTIGYQITADDTHYISRAGLYDESGQWLQNLSAVDGKGSFTMPGKSVVVKAEFEETSYQITTNPGNGNIQLFTRNIEGNPIYKAKAGQEVSVSWTITPNTASQTIQATASDTSVVGAWYSGEPSGTFVMPAQNVDITSQISSMYQISTEVQGSGVLDIRSISSSGIKESREGETVFISAVPERGWILNSELSGIYGEDGNKIQSLDIQSPGGYVAISMPPQNVVVKATFEHVLYTITTIENEYGSVAVTDERGNPIVEGYYGDTIQVKADSLTKEAVKTISYQTEGGEVYNIATENGIASFKMPDSNITVQAGYQLVPDDQGNYIISNYEELVKAAQLVRTEAYQNANFVLANHINAGGASWEQLFGTSMQPYNGTFDGRGYNVYNLNIDLGEESSFFGTIGTSGVVKNFGIFYLDVHGVKASGMALDNHGVMDECIMGSNVTGGWFTDKDGNRHSVSELNSTIEGSNQAAGLVLVNRGIIRNSRNYANVSAKQAGGIVLDNQGTIENSVNGGTISGTQEGAGIALMNQSVDGQGGIISNVYNRGNMAATTSGSIVGTNNGICQNTYYLNTAAFGDNQGTELKTSEMKDQTFCDQLNQNIQGREELREWLIIENKNSGYPNLQSSMMHERTLENSTYGVTVSGVMHEDANLVVEELGNDTEAYQAFRTYARKGGKTIEAIVQPHLYYGDNYEAEYENELKVAVYLGERKLSDEYQVLKYANGSVIEISLDKDWAVTEVTELPSIAIVKKDEAPLAKMIQKIKTGDTPSYMIWAVLLIAAIVAAVMIVWWKRRGK